jgi:hypothetical protein
MSSWPFHNVCMSSGCKWLFHVHIQCQADHSTMSACPQDVSDCSMCILNVKLTISHCLCISSECMEFFCSPTSYQADMFAIFMYVFSGCVDFFLLSYMSDGELILLLTACKSSSWMLCCYSTHCRHLAFTEESQYMHILFSLMIILHSSLLLQKVCDSLHSIHYLPLITSGIHQEVSLTSPSPIMFMPIDWTITLCQLVCHNHVSHSTDLTPCLGCVYSIWTSLHPADDLVYPYFLFTRKWDSQSLLLYQYVWHTCFHSMWVIMHHSIIMPLTSIPPSVAQFVGNPLSNLCLAYNFCLICLWNSWYVIYMVYSPRHWGSIVFQI